MKHTTVYEAFEKYKKRVAFGKQKKIIYLLLSNLLYLYLYIY